MMMMRRRRRKGFPFALSHVMMMTMMITMEKAIDHFNKKQYAVVVLFLLVRIGINSRVVSVNNETMATVLVHSNASCPPKQQ